MNNFKLEAKQVENNYRDGKKEILETYQKDKAKEMIQQLRRDSEDQLQQLYNIYMEGQDQYIKEKEAEIAATKEKPVDDLKRNNQLIKLSLIKDNPKALLKEINNNKGDRFILETIEDMTTDKDIEHELNQIKMTYPENVVEQLKRNYRYEKMNSDSFTKIKDLDMDLSAYTLTD